MEPGLTTIRINSAEVAKSAAAILHQLLSAPDAEVSPQISDTCLVVRETTGPSK
jgi:DNA-binding LacI/PurR family transcriptional regulator